LDKDNNKKVSDTSLSRFSAGFTCSAGYLLPFLIASTFSRIMGTGGMSPFDRMEISMEKTCKRSRLAR
jgi:hypothetical protein